MSLIPTSRETKISFKKDLKLAILFSAIEMYIRFRIIFTSYVSGVLWYHPALPESWNFGRSLAHPRLLVVPLPSTVRLLRHPLLLLALRRPTTTTLTLLAVWLSRTTRSLLAVWWCPGTITLLLTAWFSSETTGLLLVVWLLLRPSLLGVGVCDDGYAGRSNKERMETVDVLVFGLGLRGSRRGRGRRLAVVVRTAIGRSAIWKEA